MDNNQYTLAERVAILETKMVELLEIKDKLDELLALKNKGAGAFWFVSILVGSGLLGVVTMIISWLSKPHL